MSSLNESRAKLESPKQPSIKKKSEKTTAEPEVVDDIPIMAKLES